MTSVWVVRSEYGKYSEHFLKGGYVAAGWLRARDVTSFDSKDAVIGLYKTANSTESPNRAGANAGQLATFVLDIKPGDYVVTPRSNTEWLDYGPVLDGALYYAPDAGDGCPFPHRWKVGWADEPLRRWDLSIPFQKTLGAQKTVFSVSHVGEFLEKIGVSAPSEPALQDPQEVILGRILELDPSEFEELTRALLESLGFEETEVTGKTGDGGVDVIGELNVANLAKVKLFVQAKRYGTARVTDKPVRDLRKVIPQGCQGAVITTSEFDSKARDAALEPGFPPIGLIDGHQLVDLLVEHWNAEPLVPLPRSAGPQAGTCAGLMAWAAFLWGFCPICSSPWPRSGRG